MKHVYKSFTLYPNELFSVQGNDTYYTYQNVGANTATIKGSNDSKTWFTIASVAVGEITQQTHSYAFLKLEGATEVRGTRGNSGTATSSSNPLPVNIVSSSNPSPVGGKSVQKSASFTRPANTTTYAANDAIADSTSVPTLLSFANCANANGGQGYIVKTRLLTNQKTCTARFRLSFYHTAPSPINDNAPKPMLYANKDKLIGRIDLDPCNTEDTTSDAAYALSTTLLPYVCAPTNTTIYCILTTLDAFTPAYSQQFFLEITCELS